MFYNINIYKDEYYGEIEERYIQDVSGKLTNQDSKYCKSWVKVMSNIFEMTCRVQEKSNKEIGVIPPCCYLRLSFLHTSALLVEQEPCFMVEFFADDGDNPWAKARIKATDVLGDWQTFAGQAYRKDLWYARYYDPDVIQSLLVQTQQKILYIWLNRARYWMRELEDTPEFRKLLVTEEFQITVGAYRDWQEPIFRLRTDVDLLDAQGESLAGAFFVAKRYRDVVIEEIDAETAEFIDCRLEKVTFKDTNLCDCRFRNCRFYGVTFQDCKLAGASFEKSLLAACEFQNCDFNPDSEAMDANKLYRGVSFTGNKMQKCSFVACDFQGMHQRDNDLTDCEGAFV